MAERKHRRVIQQPDRRANRTILVRTLILLAVFGVAAFVPLFIRLWQLQIRDFGTYQSGAVENQTADTTVAAQRGAITDRNGEVLAMSATVYNIQLSPKEILECQEKYREKAAQAAEDGEPLDYPEPTNDLIAARLAAILDLEEADILERLAKTQSMYEIIKYRVDEDTRDQVLQFLEDYHLTGVYTPPTTMRIYPKSSLAAQVVGWVNYNTGNEGAYGIEAQYNDVLAGESGRIVTAKNADGTQMLYRFEDYYDGLDGCDLELTLDSKIQSFCENILAKGIEQFEVQDGGFCIAMDPNTGEILAWANSPTFDLNDPWTVTDPILNQYLADVQSGAYTKEEAYQKALEAGATAEEAREEAITKAETNVLYEQWANRSVGTTYEPGSTFKSVVLAAALEEGVVTESDHFYCPGYIRVEGWSQPILCSDRDGHEDQDLAKAVANSCNPAFVMIGQKLGAEKFYDYLEDFGFLEKTGIDLIGEEVGIIWPRDEFTHVDLAAASFGQRFTTTPIRMLTAAAAVVNGGHLMQPYVVSQITAADGSVLQTTQPTEIRQVISEQTSQRCRAILEKVVDGGTGKNARVEGYRIGGKTGSSQTTYGEDYTIVSFLGFAPADDPQVIILLAYNSPKPAVPGGNTTADGWYISGGNMAALMAGELLEDILGHLGVEKTYSATADVLVPNLNGRTLADATTILKRNNLTLRTVGEGDTVTGQIPASGASIPGGSQVVLYMGQDVPTDQVAVPNVVGLTLEQAQKKMEDAGLYLKATGASSYGSSTAYEQATPAGTLVDRGTAVEVRFTDSTASGAGL